MNCNSHPKPNLVKQLQLLSLNLNLRFDSNAAPNLNPNADCVMREELQFLSVVQLSSTDAISVSTRSISVGPNVHGDDTVGVGSGLMLSSLFLALFDNEWIWVALVTLPYSTILGQGFGKGSPLPCP